jgi:hypothetical protein
MIKLIATILSVLVGLGLAASFSGAQPPTFGDGPAPKAKIKEKGDPKKKGKREPGADLSKAYDLLRRLRADDGASGRPEERLKDWTDRAAGFYRQGLKAMNASDMRLAREYGAAAHDLARAVDHARNAVRFDRPDPDLPPPSDDFGLEDARERSRRDLYRAYERIGWLGQWQAIPNAEFYIKAARDLYSAARRDLEAGRDERAGELARAAEAMTHVPEHLAQAGEDRGRLGYRPVAPPEGPDGPGPKAKRPEPKAKRPEPKAKRPEPKDDDFEPLDRPGAGLPPALPPGV